jgi:hypothetical protein
VPEGVGADEGVAHAVGVGVPLALAVGVAVGDGDAEALPLCDSEPVTEGDAP